jgi:hypothetical protein
VEEGRSTRKVRTGRAEVICSRISGQWTDRQTDSRVRVSYLVLLAFFRLDALHVRQFVVLLCCHPFLSKSCTYVQSLLHRIGEDVNTPYGLI